jgi:hypothetical protein
MSAIIIRTIIHNDSMQTITDYLHGDETLLRSHQSTEEYLNILWSPKFHFRVHESSPLTAILSHINPADATPSNIHFNTIFAHTSRFYGGLFSSGFPTKTP